VIDGIDDTTQIMALEIPVAPTVLVIDDDTLVLARLHELVAAAGYEVRTATGGIEALDSLKHSYSSIVVMDLNMPDMDGLELCRRIRDHAWPGYIYIMLLTARDKEKDILAGLDAGADDYLSKRTSAAQFVARLRTAKRVLSLEYWLKNALAKKRELAMTDALTGIYNRRYFIRHLSRELKRVQRFGGEVSLLLLDIDHFKRVNDTYGHLAGDIVLRQFARRVTHCLRRATDWCARLGGDEFVVVLEGTNLAGARACAGKVRRAIASAPIETPSGVVHVTVSIGISGSTGLAGKGVATAHSLLDHADGNLYVSKARGRNRVTSSNGQTVEARDPANQGSEHVNAKVPVHSVC